MDISYSKRSLINCGVDFFSLLLWFSLEHHTFPKIPQHQKKTYAMTILTRNFVILYQSRDRRLDLYFLLLFRSRWIFRFSFTINMSWPATETTKLYYDTMYLPVRLISAPWGTTKTDKCYRLSFDLFTAAVDRDGRPRTKKTSGRLLAIQTFRSVHRK